MSGNRACIPKRPKNELTKTTFNATMMNAAIHGRWLTTDGIIQAGVMVAMMPAEQVTLEVYHQ